MKMNRKWLKRAAMLCVIVASALAGFCSNAATGLTLNDGDTLTGVYEDYEITIAAGATVTFNGATITHTSGSGRAAIDCAGNATIVLAEGSVNGVTNTVDSCAAIHPATNATLTIRGSGSLDAYSSGDYGAGIGAASARSNANPYPCGNIVIEGGTITAQGGSCGAGVGAAAWSSPCGDITITGNAVVTASSGQYAAAIGAASDSSPCGNITISGNASVTARKDAYQNAAGIGACHSSPCGNIVIDTTGTVDAKGSYSAAIGASYESTGTCGDITIRNGTIFADGGDRCSGIGATFAAESGSILISGGTITAEGETDGAGIGARGATSFITISGGVIDARGGASGAGIGSCNNTTCGDITITEGITRVVALKGMSANASVGAGGGSATVGTVTISSQLVRYDYMDGSLVIFTHGGMEQITPVLTTGGAADWYVEDEEGLQPGAWRSGAIGDLTNTWLKIAVSKPCDVFFCWKVSSESGYDYLRLYLNGVELEKISGNQDWAICSVTIDSSLDDLRLSYGKDRSTARDSDCGWVKDISIVPFDGTVRTVTVDSNCQDVNSYNVYVVDGYTFETMPPIARYGYAFLGLFTAAEGGEQVTAPCAVTANTTFYAHWVKTLDFEATGSKHNDADALDPSDDVGWQVEDDGITWHSGAIGDSTNSWARFTLKRPGTLSFKWKVSSEINSDYLRFYVDGVEQTNISGNVDWADVSWTSDDARNHVVEFRYTKDGLKIDGLDCGWVKDVVFTPFEDVLAVNLDLNYDGADAVEPRYVKRGNAFDVDEIPDIPRTGYALLGWFTDAVGGEQVTAIGAVTADTTLHARWVKTGDFEYTLDNTNHKGSLNWTLFEKPQDGFEAGTWRTGPIGDNQETWIETSVTGPCTVFFKWKVSSEGGFDFLRFYVGEEQKAETSGDKTNQWEMVSCEIAESGSHVVKWLYHKDSSTVRGLDCGWVKDFVVTQGGNPYTVTWMNGNVAVETDDNVEPGGTPSYDSALPTQAATAQYYYDFAGWDPELELVSSNTTYTAKYTATLRSYDVTWQNEDGTPLGATNIFYGATPTYSGATPTKAATPKYTYTFDGWTPEVAAVTGEATYTATYDATINEYTITWKNDDGTVIDSADVAYDETPTHADPTKASTAQYHYEFAGWDPEVASVSGEAAYTATFTPILRSYTITWLNENGSQIDTSTVEYGATPSHAAPTKASTAQYDYTFAGWGEVVEVSGEATYQATFTPVLRSYTITWLNDDNSLIGTTTVAYGTTPTHAAPTKAETAEYTYTFAGWSPVVVSVTGAATYTAQFNATKRSYTITWANIDGAGASATSTVEYGTVPAYGGATPTKAETAEYTYEFAGWSPAIVAVTGNATYTATFAATPKEPEDEFAGYVKISDVEGFNAIANNLATNYVLMADIDLQNVERQPFGEFSGILDGNGHAIRNINIKGGASNERGTGLFQALNNGAIVRNLTLENGTVESLNTTEDATGGIAGHVYNSVTIENCTVDLNVKGYQYVGGIVGYARYSGNMTIRRCRSFADVTGTYCYVGGLLGNAFQMDVLVEDSYSCGMVTADDNYAGGLVGYKYQGMLTIRNCFQKSVVEPNANNDRKLVGNGDGNATITGNPTVIDSLPKGGVRIAVVENGGTGTAAYVNGELVATPSEGSALERWIGEVPSGEFNDVKVWAVFCEAVEETYTVTWKNDDGTTLETDVGVAYGAKPVYDGDTPTKAADAQYTYEFAGWAPAVAAVTGDTVYTATFNAIPKSESGTVDVSTLANGDVVQNGSVLTGTAPNLNLKVADGATITLDGVCITNSASNVSVLHCLGDATIILAPGSENTVVGTVGRYCDGNAIYVPTNSTLTIKGSGALYADSSSSDNKSAAIGAFAYPYNADYVFPCGNIVIEGGTITAKGGVGIGASGNGGYCGDITITGDANVTAIATVNGSAGIGSAGSNGNCGDITISGNASVTATGKYNGPGIGAADHSTCGDIVISTTGTVTATGDYVAPGIGACGAYEGCTCGNITITSGTVSATGGIYAAGIGTDYYYQRSGTCGNITIEDTITEVVAQGQNNAPGIYTASPSEFTYGSHLRLVTSDENRCYTLTPVSGDPEGVIDLSTLTGNYTAQNGDTLTGATGYEITIAAGATVTLDGVDIACTSGSDPAVTCLGDATIILAEGSANSIDGSATSYAGIFIYSPGSDTTNTLTIAGTGALTVLGGDKSAGIGSNAYNNSGSAGNIVISGGTVTATGGEWAAGIGSGYRGTCGDITITGGTVTANIDTTTSDRYTDTAALGAGCRGECGNILISGGTVTAISVNPQSSNFYDRSCAIGATYSNGRCGNITITDGITSVTATKGATAQQHIGQGDGDATIGTVTISPRLAQTLSNNDLTLTLTPLNVPETVTITWVDEDGTTLETDTVAYSATPTYDGETPTKTEDAQYTYEFAGWTPAVGAATSNTTYTATFSETLRSYTVSWVVEGVTVASGTVEYGATPVYGGDTPAKASTAEYSYEFIGWTPVVAAVTGDATYTAQFNATKRSYTVSWVVDGMTVASGVVEYGTTPIYDGDTPAKASTAEYSYEFTGWTPVVAAVTGDATYTAQFSQTKRSYTVSWVVEGATVASGTVEYGQMPAYGGDTPTKPETAEYTYTFNGWTPAIAAVTDDATYTAQFSRTKRTYTVSWVVEGATVASGSVEYGQTPAYGGATPTKESTAEYSYEFSGWSPAVSAVTGAATYTAQFEATKRSYTITWANIDGAGASSTSTVEYGQTPVYGGAAPTKAEDKNYTYTFSGWSPAVASVTGPATYTATFAATPKEPDDPDEPYEGTETINGITWSYTVANGEATITDADGASGNIVIPDAVHEGVPVTAIASGVLADNRDITSVTIGRNVRRIGEDVGVKADDWEQNLEEVGFDGSYPAFGNCESLLNYLVAAGNTVFEEIDGCLYYRDTPNNNKKLALYPSGRSTLYFDDGITVTAIGDGACAWCHQFTALTIPASVREIGARAFDFCREVVTLSIPSSVTNLCYGAFLMNIALENASINGTDLTIGDYAFYHSFMADNAGYLVIRGGVKEIGLNAFCHSMHLGAVVMEDGVTNIAMNAFSQCDDLAALTLPDTLKTIGAGAFFGCCDLRELIVPLSVEDIGLSQPDDGSDGGAFAISTQPTKIYMPLSLKPATAYLLRAYLANVFDGLGLEDMEEDERDEILTWYSDYSEIGGGGEPEEPVEEPDAKRWMVVDLRTGDVSYYGYDFDTATNTFNTTEYKTVKIAFRKVPKGEYFIRNGTKTARMERDYYMALFATTEAQYQLMLNPAANVSGASTAAKGSVSWISLRGTTEVTPQGSVSNNFGDAVIYRLNELTGLKFDLPTVPMWEVASLAKPTNATETASWSWFFGPTIDNLAEYAWNGGWAIYEVGLLKPNAWGLYDVYGNVWEWCADGIGTERWNMQEAFEYDWQWTQTPNGDGRDPSCRHCVGGSTWESRDYCNSVFVNTAYKVASYSHIGFRLSMICEDEPVEIVQPYDGVEVIGGVEWSYTLSNDEATITGVSSLSGGVAIPATVAGGYPVTAIADYLDNRLRYNENITSVTIPASVTNIGEGNFMSCTGLVAIIVADGNAAYASDDGVLYNADKTELIACPGGKTVVTNIPDSVREFAPGAFNGSRIEVFAMPLYATNIAESAFSECSYLSSVSIEKHVKSIGANAFWNCGNLRTVNFPSDSECEVIGENAFCGCAKLQRVAIPDSVTVIRGGAFSGCSELFDVTIGSNVVQIGDGVGPLSILDREEAYLGDFVAAFGDCANLMNFKVASGNTIYEAIDGCIYYRATPKAAKTLAVYPSGRSSLYFHGDVTVTGIGEGACSSCNKLTNLSIPETVRDIGVEAFAHCEKLAKVYIAPNTVTNISFGAFIGDQSIMDVQIAGSVKTIGDGAFLHCFMPPNLHDEYTTGRLVLNEGIQRIGVQAFFICVRIGEIVIPNSVTSIGEMAFGNTQYARRIVIGSGLREIGESAFECDWGGSRLSELVIGPNVVKIGAYAFAGCEKVRALDIPGSVQHIGDNAFRSCSSLCALNLPGGLKSIGAGAFGGSSYGMMMSSGRALLGSSAQTFDDCTDLRRVLVPNSVTNIGVGAFGAVTSENLDRIYLPSSLKSADDSDTLAFLADQFPGRNLGVDDVTWYGNESELNYVTVTFDPNNGGETWSEQVLDYMDAFPIPMTNGYAFVGWWTTSDDSGEQVTLFRHFDANTTLYAHWIETPVTFGADAPWTAVYDDDLGDWVIQSGDVAFGYTSSASMTVTGPCIVTYSFKNIMSAWGTSNDLKILVDGEEVECWGIFDYWTEQTIEVAGAGEHTVTWRYVNMNGDINDYARLCNISTTSAEAHTVTFHLEDGTMTEATSRQAITSLGTLPLPTKNGVLFAGWYTAATGGDRITSDYEVEDDLDLYAHWTVAPFEIGGDVGWYVDEDESYTCEHVGIGQRASAQIAFTGSRRIQFSWKLSAEGMTDDNLVLYVDGEQVFTMHGDRNWESCLHDVIGDGGHVVRWEFRRMGYSYETDADNRMWLKNISTTPLLAVAFNPNYAGGETIMGGAVSGTPYGELPSVKRKGYRLVGWFTAATGGTKVTSSTLIYEAMTLYAHWEESGPEISYALNDRYNDGWNGAAIRVVNDETGERIATLTIESGGEASGEIPVTNGMRLRFEWVQGSFDNETSYTIRGVDDEVILSGSGSGFSTPVIYEVVVATPEPPVPETPPVEIDDTKMEEPVENGDGTCTINAKEGETLTQSDVESVAITSPTDPTVDITEAYTKTLSPEGDKIVLELAQPVIEEIVKEENIDAEDPMGLLEEVTKIGAFKVAELPIPDISDPNPANHEEVGALPVKMHKGLWYQASWGDDLNAMTQGVKFRADGVQTHIGVIKQTGSRGFYKISVSEK